MRLTIYFLIILPLIIFVSKPSYSGENAVLLAMKLECGGNSAGRKPYNDYFFALTTDYTFQGNRYWIGKNKYEGDVGLNIFSGVRTHKSLLIKGEGKWLKKTSKDWKLQFISKGNKSMFEHLEAGIEGFEGKDKWRRECKLVLLNKVKAGDAIQLNSYIKIIDRQKKEIKTYNDTYEKDLENTKNKYIKNIENLDKQISLLKTQNDEKNLEIIKLNKEINIAENDKELENKFSDLQNKFKIIEQELNNLEKINLKLKQDLDKQRITEEKLNKKLFSFPEERELKKVDSLLNDIDEFIKIFPDKFSLIQKESISELEDEISKLKEMIISNPTSSDLEEWVINLKSAQITLNYLNSYKESLEEKNQILELIALKNELDIIMDSLVKNIIDK